MEYKKGSIVEVVVSDGLFYSSWRCAKIVSGNGHSYTVSYDVFPGFTNKADVERVSVRSIRPSPPLLEITKCWAPGDTVEVFHDLSWKTAIVLKDLDWDQFLVRVAGVFHDFEVTKAELRLRQSYQNDEWIIIDKVSKEYERDAKGDFYQNCLSESSILSSKSLKQASSCCYSQGKANEERLSEKEESVLSSSGSCSSKNYNPYEVYQGSDSVEDTESHESDAESVCRLGYHEEADQSPTNEALADRNHRLELLLYSSTMEALHALGPLSWEKETTITSLRMSLHISNDEHLIMLKSLSSADSKTCYR